MLKSDKDIEDDEEDINIIKEEKVTRYTPKQIYDYSDKGSADELRLALDSLNDGDSVFWYKSQDGNGCLALHVAAHHGHIECVEVLLNIGADIESKTNQGATAHTWLLLKATLHVQLFCLIEELLLIPNLLGVIQHCMQLLKKVILNA